MESLVCESCDNSKQQLHRADSKLIKGMSLFMCADCIKKDLEPRHIVILSYISGNKLAVLFVREGRYLGKRIELQEAL